jgi:hypothetical protein
MTERRPGIHTTNLQLDFLNKMNETALLRLKAEGERTSFIGVVERGNLRTAENIHLGTHTNFSNNGIQTVTNYVEGFNAPWASTKVDQQIFEIINKAASSAYNKSTILNRAYMAAHKALLKGSQQKREALGADFPDPIGGAALTMWIHNNLLYIARAGKLYGGVVVSGIDQGERYLEMPVAFGTNEPPRGYLGLYPENVGPDSLEEVKRSLSIDPNELKRTKVLGDAVYLPDIKAIELDESVDTILFANGVFLRTMPKDGYIPLLEATQNPGDLAGEMMKHSIIHRDNTREYGTAVLAVGKRSMEK